MSQEGTIIPEPQPRRVPIPPRGQRGSGVTAALLPNLGLLSASVRGPVPDPGQGPDHLALQDLPREKGNDPTGKGQSNSHVNLW